MGINHSSVLLYGRGINGTSARLSCIGVDLFYKMINDNFQHFINKKIAPFSNVAAMI